MSVYSLETIKGKEHVQTVYTRKDNPIEVILKKDDQEYDYSSAKEIRVKIGSTVSAFCHAWTYGVWHRQRHRLGRAISWRGIGRFGRWSGRMVTDRQGI